MFATSLGHTGQWSSTPTTTSATSRDSHDDDSSRDEVSEEEQEVVIAAVVPRSVGEPTLNRLVAGWTAFGKELRHSNNRCSNVQSIPQRSILFCLLLGCTDVFSPSKISAVLLILQYR